MKTRRLGPASPPTSMQGTPPFQPGPIIDVDYARLETLAVARLGADDPTIKRLQLAGIISTDPAAARTKPAGSSPALRIGCPVCGAAAGAYCTRIKPLRYVVTGAQRIAHKKRRELEERTR